MNNEINVREARINLLEGTATEEEILKVAQTIGEVPYKNFVTILRDGEKVFEGETSSIEGKYWIQKYNLEMNISLQCDTFYEKIVSNIVDWYEFQYFNANNYLVNYLNSNEIKAIQQYATTKYKKEINDKVEMLKREYEEGTGKTYYDL